jgi:hypothetical protein
MDLSGKRVVVTGAAGLGLWAKLIAGLTGGGLVFYGLIRLVMTGDRPQGDDTLPETASAGP